MNSRRRIGFIDHRLDNYHANTFLHVIRDELSGRGYDVAGAWAEDAESGRIWAERNHVIYHDDPNDLAAHVDCFMVLAPSDPQLHPALCAHVLPFGKPTYVDKTFASNLPAAQAIFTLADRHGAAIQTSSALRHTNVQAHAQGNGPVRHMSAWGGGSSFAEYAIHPVELVISCMGPQATRLMRRGDDRVSQLVIDFTDGRTAVANVCVGGSTPFAASLTTDAGTTYLAVAADRMFIDLTSAILDLFDTGRPNVDREQSLAIRRILDAAEQPEARTSFVPLD